MFLTVFIHSEDGRPSNRQLSEGLSQRGGDVVPAFSCRGRQQNMLFEKSLFRWVTGSLLKSSQQGGGERGVGLLLLLYRAMSF